MVLAKAIERLCLDDVPNCSAVDQLTLELVTDDDVDLSQLAGIIEENPGLAGLVIGLANSAYFGSPSAVVTVRDAIVKVLGIGLVRSLVLSVILGRPLDLTRCPEFSVAAYWTHALATARFAQLLAKLCPDVSASGEDQVYLSGLLSNFGQLLLVHHYPDAMSQVLAAGRDDPGAILALELVAVGMHQGHAGALIGRHWQLPEPVVCVMRHALETDYRGDNWALAMLVGEVSRLLARYRRDEEVPVPAPGFCEQLGIAETDVVARLEALPDVYCDLERVAGHLASSF